ncbi:MAG: hypothetical protein HFJ28_07265 [Clostridia bacterium]|nr:hypothetical protein [Clostridia bacterium]
MDTSNLKNIVVLKDLPSNIVEEAIVVLKENQKVPKLEFVDKTGKQNKQKQEQGKEEKKAKDYVVKEAQMLITEYISKIENKNKKENKSLQTLKSKYKKVKTLNYILMGCLAMSALLQLMIF